MKKVIVIGGGAAGLMAAYSASFDNEVILLEKNGECGKKLNICGKGRGNVTNSASLNEFVAAFGKNGKFLYSAFSQFFNNDLINFFENNGLDTIEERGGRIFPKSEIARDVRDLFISLLNENNVKIKYGTSAKSIEIKDNKVVGVNIHDGLLKCDSVILATGGLSYPKTGSNGDGYRMARELGHNVTELKPSICPIYSKTSWIKDVVGLSLKNVEVSLVNKNNNKVKRSEFGEMLFTHKGVSGPIILTLSKYLAEEKNIKDFKLILDLKPNLNEEVLYEKLTKEFTSNINLKNYFVKILPKSLAKIFSIICNIDENIKVNKITKNQKLIIISKLKKLEIDISSLSIIDEAIITQGGIDIKEIDSKTLESKLIDNLYFAGEIIDIDAKTGGFNLQAAFSTGFVAGQLK